MDGRTLAAGLGGAAQATTYAKAALVAVVACVIALALGLGVGAWLGIEWQQGRQAQADVAGLKRQADDLVDAAETLRARGLDIAADFRTASRRMDLIAQEHADEQAKNRDFYRTQNVRLAQLLRERPDLDAVDVGADLLCHWNRNLQGAGAATATAAPGCAGDAAPGAARPAAGQRRPPADASAQPGAGGAGVPGVSQRSGQPGQGGRRVRADGVGVVLPGAGGDRREGERLPTREEG